MKHTMFASIALTLALAAIAAPVAEARRGQISEVNYAGSGCPAGSLHLKTLTVRDTLLIYLDRFAAETGSDVPLSASRKNCQISLPIEPLRGWTYGIESIAFAGRAYLDHRVDALASASAYFQGEDLTAKFSEELQGSHYGSYLLRASASKVIYAPCDANRALNLNLQVRANNLRNRKGEGYVSLNEPVVVRLKWKRC